MIIQSANDACIMLAEGIAGSEAEFRRQADAARARDRPCQIDFHQFERPARSGHAGDARANWRCSRARSSVNYPDYYPIFGQTEFTWNKIQQQNRNPLLPMNIGADGLKTGFTKEAGYGLVGSAVQNGLRLIVVVNGTKTAKERARRGQEAARMGLPQFRAARCCSPKARPSATPRSMAARRGTRAADGGRARCSIMVPKAGGEKLIARIVYSGPGAGAGPRGPAGRHAQGVARRQSGARDAAARPPNSVGKGNISQRAFDAVTELVIGLFRAGAERL